MDSFFPTAGLLVFRGWHCLFVTDKSTSALFPRLGMPWAWTCCLRSVHLLVCLSTCLSILWCLCMWQKNYFCFVSTTSGDTVGMNMRADYQSVGQSPVCLVLLMLVTDKSTATLFPPLKKPWACTCCWFVWPPVCLSVSSMFACQCISVTSKVYMRFTLLLCKLSHSLCRTCVLLVWKLLLFKSYLVVWM